MDKTNDKFRVHMTRHPNRDWVQNFRDLIHPNSYELDDRFVVRDGDKHPFAVICPGGGYTMVYSFHEGTPIARELNKHGITAFIVYYRVRRKAHFPNAVDDLACAVRKILDHADDYNVVKEGYSVWGFSAGGHLAASFATESMGYPKYGLPRPGAVILSYPLISMDSAVTHRRSHNYLLGRNATSAMEHLVSVDEQVTPLFPPCYLWSGDADALLNSEHMRRMADALKQNEVPRNIKIYPGVGHGVGKGTGTPVEGWIDQAVEFWLGK